MLHGDDISMPEFRKFDAMPHPKVRFFSDKISFCVIDKTITQNFKQLSLIAKDWVIDMFDFIYRLIVINIPAFI